MTTWWEWLIIALLYVFVGIPWLMSMGGSLNRYRIPSTPEQERRQWWYYTRDRLRAAQRRVAERKVSYVIDPDKEKEARKATDKAGITSPDSQFKKLSECFPDWHDCGESVVVIDDEGVTIAGILRADDEFFTGEDEVPLFCIELKTGEKLSFADKDLWRFGSV